MFSQFLSVETLFPLEASNSRTQKQILKTEKRVKSDYLPVPQHLV